MPLQVSILALIEEVEPKSLSSEIKNSWDFGNRRLVEKTSHGDPKSGKLRSGSCGRRNVERWALSVERLTRFLYYRRPKRTAHWTFWDYPYLTSYSMGLEIPATLISLGLISGIISSAGRRYSKSSPEIHFAPNPAVLPVRKDGESKEVEYISIRTLLETRCKSLFTDFHPLWWLSKWVFSFLLNLTRINFSLQRPLTDDLLYDWRFH